MADRDVCALCGHSDDPPKGWVHQDNGLPVHVICRDATFWNVGEKVVTRAWKRGDPVAVVTNVKRVADYVAGEDGPVLKPVEIVEVVFLGTAQVEEFTAPEIVRAPSNAQ